MNRLKNVSLRRNVGSGTARDPKAMGHWLAVRLRQEAPNVDAIGAWIEVKVRGQSTVREVTVGGGHASGELGPVHFGLGRQTKAQVQVTWPDGVKGPWQVVRADETITLDRGAAVARTDGSSGS